MNIIIALLKTSGDPLNDYLTHMRPVAQLDGLNDPALWLALIILIIIIIIALAITAYLFKR